MQARLPWRGALAASAVAGTLVLSACGNSGGVGGATSAAQDSASAGTPVTLNFETWFPDQATLQPAIDAFEKANPNIKINLRILKSQDFQKQLPLQLQGGEALDVVGFQVSAMTKNVKDQLREVDSYADQLGGDWEASVNPAFVDQTKLMAGDRKLYGLPLGAVSSPWLYYNNEILTKAGITAPPATIAELADDVAKIKASQPEVTSPVVMTGDGWWQEEMYFGFAEQKSPGLSQAIINGDTSWNTPEVVAGLKAFKELVDSGAVDTSVYSLSYDDANSLFNTGKAAFYFNGSWAGAVMTTSFQETNKTSGKDYGAVPAPISSQGGSASVRSLAEGGLGIPKASQHVAEAAKFIAYLTYGDGVDQWNSTLQYNPDSKVGWAPSSDVLATPAAQAGFKSISEISAKASSIRDDQQDFLANVSGPTFLKVLRGEQSPEDAAAYLQQEWTSGRYPHNTLTK